MALKVATLKNAYGGDSACTRGGSILVRAECVRCPWLLAETKVATILGIFLFYLFFSPPLFKITEGVVVGFQIFAWAPN